MDEGKGGQTQSLQEREGENRRQSANLGRNGRGGKGKDGISRARAIPSKKVTGRELVEGGPGGGGRRHMTVALAMAWPRRAELWWKQCLRY